MKIEKNKSCITENLNWNEFYKNKSNLVPRETLIKVLEIFDKEDKAKKKLKAIDLGCGHGSDTIELLKRGWHVTGVDYQKDGLRILKESISPEFRRRLKVDLSDFKNVKLSSCNLINASYSLPFCHPKDFGKLWEKIEESIVPGGRFAGNFFGKNDEWANDKKMTFLSEKEVKKFFVNFEIEYFHERDEDGQTSDGTKKHWHVFSVIARKNEY